MRKLYFTSKGTAVFQFAYSPLMVAAIKELPGRRWDPAKKVWYVPQADPVEIEKFAIQHKFEVSEKSQAYINDYKKTLLASSQPGFDIPKVKTPPWSHQKTAYGHLLTHEAALLDMGMGTGKSKVIVDYIVNNPVFRTLIICPKSVIPVWPYQIGLHAAEHLEVLPLLNEKSVAEKAEIAMKVWDTGGPPFDKQVFIINYESVWRDAFARFALDKTWDLVVLDECHRIKAPGGKASRFMARLRDHARRRVGLSGTPLPHSPLDIYAQYRFLDPRIYGTSFHRFRDEYAVMGGYDRLQVVGFRNQAELAERMNRIRFHASRDVLDLPEVVHQVVPINLPDKARQIYGELEDEFYTEVEHGEVTVANALVKLLRLQQVTSGHLGDDEGEVHHLHLAKQEALIDYLGALPTDEPVVVFSRFRRDLLMTHAAAYGVDRGSCELSGKVKQLESWQAGDAPILAVQIGAGAEGIDLTRARYCVFFSLGFSLGQYEQALARLHRPGQTRTVFYTHLICQHSVDEKVYGALETRKQVVEDILARGRKS